MHVYRPDLTSANYKRDPYSTWKSLREAGSCIKVKLPFIGKVWGATTHQAVTELLRNDELFVRDPQNAGRKYILPFQWALPRIVDRLSNNMLGRDQQDHRRLRKLVEHAFAQQSINDMRPQIDTLADQFLDEMEVQAKAGPVDFIQHFARPFPLAVISELMGLAHEDRPRFMDWGQRLSKLRNVFDFGKLIWGLRGLQNYFEEQFEKCRQQPQPGLLSALVQAELKGDRLNHEELMASAFLLLFAGHETTVHLITASLISFFQYEHQKQSLFKAPQLVGTAVEEVLRYFSPIEFTKPRFVAEDTDFFGQTLQRGDSIMGLIAAANHDPEVFDQPSLFDITRAPNPHLSFGTGVHICLGIKLARAEAQVALEKVFSRFPNLKLAIPLDELSWASRPGVRSVKQLPLIVS